jgi:SPP1 gp7 family putative phage head morphogenesis protein
MMNILEVLHNSTRYNKKFFEEWAIPVGMVMLKDMKPTEIKRFAKLWKQRFKGKPWKIGFTSREIDWKDFTKSLKDMQWLEGTKFYMRLACSMYKVPVTELGFTDESRGKNPDSNQTRSFLRKAVIPLLKLMEAKFNKEIIPEFYLDKKEVECRFKFNYVDEIEEQRKLLNNIAEIKVGALTVNEHRAEKGRDPVAWGDEKFVGQSGFGFSSEGVKALKKKITQRTSEVRTYDEFLVDYYAELEAFVLDGLMRSGIGVIKAKVNLEKGYSDFFRHLLVAMSTLPVRNELFRVVKMDFSAGIEEGEGQTGVQVGYQEKFNPYINALTEEELTGYVMPDGKRWFGISGVNEDLRKEIIDSIKEGLDNRESHDQLAKRIKTVFGEMPEYRNMRIARTESNRIMNQGTNMSYVESGIKGHKEWLSAIDERTSPICRRLNGQKVSPTEAFTDPSTGVQFHHPPAHPNCRSTIVFVPDKEQ